MSVRGLYDSEVGDKLARKSLAPFIVTNIDIDDEEPRASVSRRKCACGNTLIWPTAKRNNVYVCSFCAAKIPRVKGGRPVSLKCSRCGGTFPRSRLVVRQGKLCCKACDKGF